MSNEYENVRYTILSDPDKSDVRNRLPVDHEYFFHATPVKNLDSIRENGLDPRFESSDSAYACRHREPGKAIRYCTKTRLQLALSAAETKSQQWDGEKDRYVSGPPPLLLRIKATVLLGRSFGLDHSFADVEAKVDSILKSSERLTPDEFIEIIDTFGSMSCYECVPPGEIEVCTEERLTSSSNDWIQYSASAAYKPLAH